MRLSNGTEMRIVGPDSDIVCDDPHGGAVRFEWRGDIGLAVVAIREGAVKLPPMDADQVARTIRYRYELHRHGFTGAIPAPSYEPEPHGETDSGE